MTFVAILNLWQKKAAHHGNLSNSNSHNHYVHKFCNTVRAGRKENDQRIDPVAARQLESDLGKLGATNGIMPDFSNVQALRGYAVSHFGRARLLSRLITERSPKWLTHRMNELVPICENTTTTICESSIGLASLAGGPGYDFVCLAALCQFRQGPRIAATVFEYEPAWSEIVADVESVVQDICQSQQNFTTTNRKHHCGYAPCDITLSLEAASNESLAGSLEATQIYTCSYAVAENAVRLRQQEFVFFRQLFHEAANGSLFFLTETTHRLWPELIDLALATQEMRVSIPHLRCGKQGWHLALLKDTSMVTMNAILTPAHQELYQRFQRDDNAHRERLGRKKQETEATTKLLG